MATQPHILIVEDDPEISTLLSRFLRNNNCRVSLARSGRDMDRLLADARVDLIVLDLMLPGEDGLSLCRRLRENSKVPIIILSAKGDEIDRIIGLEVGADDYLAKPFNPRELLARIRAVLRRWAEGGDAARQPEARVLAFAGWRFDSLRRNLVSPDNVRIVLTSGEAELLTVFCQRPRRVLSRDQIADLTQRRTLGPSERSIDILVARLRRKIEADTAQPEFIVTVRSEGYVFTPDVVAQ